MKLTARKTYAFVEIEVDEIKTTVFASDSKEVKEMIYNLLSVANDLASYTGRTLTEYVELSEYN